MFKKNPISFFIVLLLVTSCKHAPINTIIVCDGNSLTYGKDYGTPYPEQMEDDLPNAAIYNFGVIGQQTSEMMKDADVQVDTLLDTSKACICVAWEITNDIYFNGNAQQAVERFKQYCLDRKAKGWKVIAINVLPRNQSPKYQGDKIDFNRKINEANALLAVQWNNFADGFVDVGKDTRFSDPTNKTYFKDGIHLTTKGFSIIADDVVQCYRTLN